MTDEDNRFSAQRPDRESPREPTPERPSDPRDLRFDPFATMLGVFFAIAIPSFVLAYRSGSLDVLTVVVGVGLAVVIGVGAGMWVSARDGVVWRGPQL